MIEVRRGAVFLFLFLSVFFNKKISGNFNLITVLYNEKNEERAKEYIYCLEKNVKNDRIKTVHIIYDTSKDDEKLFILNYLKSKNLPITYINTRPSYAFCFDLANTHYPDSKVILSNADIYFDETLFFLDGCSLSKTFLAITRWNEEGDGSLFLQNILLDKKRCGSQDTWIFSTPIKIFGKNIMLGVLGCDATIAYEAYKNGLTVQNPCLSIITRHLHLSSSRNYMPSFRYPSSNYYYSEYDFFVSDPLKNRLKKEEVLEKAYQDQLQNFSEHYPNTEKSRITRLLAKK